MTVDAGPTGIRAREGSQRYTGAQRFPIIDAHHHFLDPDRFVYPWLTGEWTQLRRRFGPDDFVAESRPQGVVASVVVQACESMQESRELLQLAKAGECVAGAVVWVDLSSTSAVRQIIEMVATETIAGVRDPSLGLSIRTWHPRGPTRRALETLQEQGVALDVLLRPGELSDLAAMAGDFPGLPIVIDHLAKPEVVARRWEPWATAIRPFHSLLNVTAKVSGLVTEAAWDSWSVEDLRPYVDEALDVFGPERLMFGSDWPLCTVAASYSGVVRADFELFATLTGRERAAVFATTAARIYRLPEIYSPRPDGSP